MGFLRRHSLLLAVLVLSILSFVLFSWAEWHYFLDQAKSHHEAAPSFWSPDHIHDWLYNAASNWQSELFFGIVLLLVLRDLGAHDPGDGD